MPSANPWTPAEDAVLRRMKSAGMAWQDISVALGRSAEAVRARWRTASAQEAKPVSAGSKEWTEAEDERLKAACAKGGTWIEVAGRVGGRSARACESRAGMLGLKRRSGRRKKEPERRGMLSRRKCHDCGRPTVDYRCPACLAAWRRRNGVSGAAEEEEGYAAFGGAGAFD